MWVAYISVLLGAYLNCLFDHMLTLSYNIQRRSREGGFLRPPPPAIPLPYLKNRSYMYVLAILIDSVFYWMGIEIHNFTQNDIMTSEIDWWFVCL